MWKVFLVFFISHRKKIRRMRIKTKYLLIGLENKIRNLQGFSYDDKKR